MLRTARVLQIAGLFLNIQRSSGLDEFKLRVTNSGFIQKVLAFLFCLPSKEDVEIETMTEIRAKRLEKMLNQICDLRVSHP
jgi:hypothetical protein